MKIEEAQGIAAQAWTFKPTEHKTMDTDLCQAFAEILEVECTDAAKEALSLATTEHLIEELRARIQVGGKLECRTNSE